MIRLSWGRKSWILGVTLAGLLAAAAVVRPVEAQDTYRTAYDIGYEEGQRAGAEDRQRRQPFDFANKLLYQEALTGFDETAHNREVYLVAYRRGFEDGYEDGYGLGVERRDLPPTVVVDPPEPPTPAGGRMTLPEGTQLRIRLLQTLTTSRNEPGDPFRAEVIEPVTRDSEIVVPRGTRVRGEIAELKRAGRIKGRSEMRLRFFELELPNGASAPIEGQVASIEERADEEVKEEGRVQAPGEKGEDAKKIGTSAGLGALLGILTGGVGGSKVGAGIGAVAGLAGVLATRGSDMVLQSETELNIELLEEATIPTGIWRRQDDTD